MDVVADKLAEVGLSILTLTEEQDVDLGAYKIKPHVFLVLDDGARGAQKIVRKLRRGDIQRPIVVIAPKFNRDTAIAVLQEGADDYVTFPTDLELFSEKVLRMADRFKGAGGTGEWTILGDLRMNPDTFKVYLGQTEVILTLTEFKILSYIINCQGRVVTRKELVENVQHLSHETARSVDVHICSIRKKLQNWSTLIETVRGVGYRLES